MENVIKNAKAMNEQMTYSKRDDESEFYRLKPEAPEWMREVSMKAHGERWANDYDYRWIAYTLDALNCQDDDASEDEIEECYRDIEPDCYTSQLTDWLSDDNHNVGYLEEGISLGITDGFQLLAVAQKTRIDEVASALIEALSEVEE